MLKQGKKYLNNKNDYKYIVGEKSINRIKKTTMDGMKNIGIVEGFNINNNDESLKNSIIELKSEFDKKLNEYIKSYKSEITNITTKNNLINKYKGKIINDGEFFYINRFGVARGFTQNAWAKKPESCSKSVLERTVETTTDLTKFEKGETYNVGQPCNLDGTMVKNKLTGKIAWIDTFGRMHEFASTDIFNNSGCKNISVKTIEDEIYKTFTKTNEMSIKSTCSTGTNSYNDNLNNELIDIANKIFEKVKKLEGSELNLDIEINNIKSILSENIKNLSNHREKLKDRENKKISINAEILNNKLELRSEYYEYIFWTLSALSIGGYVIYKGLK